MNKEIDRKAAIRIARLACFSLAVAVSATGFSTQALAPLEDKSGKFFGEYSGKASPDWKLRDLKAKTSHRRVVVGKSDTVESVARTYGVTPRSVIETNDLPPPYALQAGQKLTLGATQVHRVRRGETLYGIARAKGLEPHDLIRANGLKKPYNLEVGQALVLPDRRASASVPASLDKHNTITYAAQREAEKRGKYSPGRLMTELKQLLVKTPPSPVSAPPPSSPIQSASYSAEPVVTADVAPVSPRTASPFPQDGKAVNVGTQRGGGKFEWPTKGTLLSSFGSKQSGVFNDGINISAPIGREIRAAADGTVVYTGDELKGYGNLVILRHRGGWMTAYAHQERFTVKKGEKIKKGQVIGYVGASGNVDRPQLHFAIRKGRDPVDPMKLLPI